MFRSFTVIYVTVCVIWFKSTQLAGCFLSVPLVFHSYFSFFAWFWIIGIMIPFSLHYWVIIYLFYSLSCIQLFVTPWIVAGMAPLSLGFPKQEYWSRLLLPSPEDLPHPGIEPMSPALAGGFFTAEPPLFIHLTIFTVSLRFTNMSLINHSLRW